MATRLLEPGADGAVRAARDAPLLGEHTVEVLTEVGLSSDTIEELLRDGVAEDASRTVPAGDHEASDG